MLIRITLTTEPDTSVLTRTLIFFQSQFLCIGSVKTENETPDEKKIATNGRPDTKSILPESSDIDVNRPSHQSDGINTRFDRNRNTPSHHPLQPTPVSGPVRAETKVKAVIGCRSNEWCRKR